MSSGKQPLEDNKEAI